MIEFVVKFYSDMSSIQICAFIALIAMALVLVWSKFCTIEAAWKLSLGAVAVVMTAMTSVVVLRNPEKYREITSTFLGTTFLFEIAVISLHVWPAVWLVAFSRKRSQMRANGIDLTVFK